MNQEIVFAANRHFGQTDIVELSECPFASSKGKRLKLINEWNEKVRSKEFYII
ncbi:calcineurin-like phosphoesterase family protein [Flavobacterium sp. HSC-32F16]|uniref:hypothetical protein n=1 Tax=Flavobacterium sp. HSC-32F16 TaxID=2910964 RepID=UPI0020A54955|nr:hypothetical protein [Flavobacterium sp. HSC-32F16]MCP2027896.1 calcineurin-like phosphoesterase family protein [Flavobacterium sp. HSC-32F16]